MNKVQKKITFFSLSIVSLSIIMWLLDGAYLITQSEKLIVKQATKNTDANFEVTTNFVWGLDLTLLISGIILVIAGILYRKQEMKQK